MVSAGNLELDYWLRRIRQGDRDALAELYNATGSAVYAYALSILKNSFDAQDVLHDCFVTVWQQAERYTSRDKPMAWIMTITRNLCYMHLRRQRRYSSMDAVSDTVPAPTEDRLLLRQCMQILTDEERQIVVLHAVAGMTHRQIGAMLQLKTSTVLSKYHRALKKLRTQLEGGFQ